MNAAAVYRALFASARFRRFNLMLFQLSLHGLGILNYEDMRVSGEEHWIVRVLPTLVEHDPPVFFDVGAHVGNYSRLMHQHFPNAVIHAFEPNPAAFAQLAEHCGNGIRCHNFGLAHQAGAATLFDRTDAPGSSHSSLHAAVMTDIHRTSASPHRIELRTLDEVATAEHVEYIDLLKVDTEGSEFAVLCGARNLLGRGAIGSIHFEFNEMNIVSRTFLHDFRALLKGYRLFRMLPKGLIALDDSPLKTELFGYQNVVAVRTSAAARLAR